MKRLMTGITIGMIAAVTVCASTQTADPYGVAPASYQSGLSPVTVAINDYGRDLLEVGWFEGQNKKILA